MENNYISFNPFQQFVFAQGMSIFAKTDGGIAYFPTVYKCEFRLCTASFVMYSELEEQTFEALEN